MKVKTKSGISRLVVLLVRATTYDDDGYPLMFYQGVLPSNSLAAMYSLTKAALKSLPVRGLIKVFDETVSSQLITDPAALVAQYLDGQTMVVVGLVGVQSNQFVRASHLATQFQDAGAKVAIGGFHASGSIATYHDGIGRGVPCPHIMPPEIEALMNRGIIFCHGEAEEVWLKILSDILNGKAEKLYRGGMPDLSSAPLPEYPPGYFDAFATEVGTFDTSRGCPHSCSFCTIINVQGRNTRCRDPQKIIAHVRSVWESRGEVTHFFTDDNFPRSPGRDEILDGLIVLQKEGCRFSFMIQGDLLLHQLPGFVKKLRDAGCSQVFLGVESLNSETLKRLGKRQNKVEKYALLIAELHKHGIAAHISYIIGFPEDTPESIMADVKKLRAMGGDLASFFILTPLPGSADHITMHMDRVPMSADLSEFDSMHAVTRHPKMTGEVLEKMLWASYREFYRSKYMIAALKRLPEDSFWSMVRNYLWYRNSALGEKIHPMMCGFFSVHRRRLRRPDYPRENRRTFWKRELWFRLKYIGHIFREFYIFQHVYFESRLKGEIAEQVNQRLAKAKGWWSHIFHQPNRRWLNNFWIRYGKQKWGLLRKPWWHVRMVPYAATEAIYSIWFFCILARNMATMTR